MSPRVAASLAWLQARRVLTWRALVAGPLLAAAVASSHLWSARDAAGGARDIVSAARGAGALTPGPDAARAAWLVASLAIAAAALARASAIGREWRTRDALWLGASSASRAAAALAWTAGVALGAALLAALTAALVGAPSGAPDRPLERLVDAGPDRSLRVPPGGRVVHRLDAALGATGRVLRVRAFPTVGGDTPTTTLVVRSGEATAEAVLARRTAIDLALPDGARTFEVVNAGDGAAALIGPAPFEVWAPTDALLGGHARLAGQVARIAATLAAFALLAGAWLRPGIAAGLALAALVGLEGLGGGILAPALGARGPLGQGLDAIADGRAPAPVSPAEWLGTAAVALLTAALTGPSLTRPRAGGTAS